MNVSTRGARRIRPHAPSGSLSAILALLSVAACGDSTTTPSLPNVGAVVVTSPTTEMEVGETVQLIATVLDSSGVATGGGFVSWSTSDPAVATVSGAGLVSALSPGLTVVAGSSEGVRGTVDLMVMAGACGHDVAATHALGTRVRDGLDPWDCVFEGGPVADGYAFSVGADHGVVLGLNSTEFDPVLVVTTPEMDFVGFDDDGGDDLDARFVAALPEGDYIAWALAYSGEAGGAYQLVSEVLDLTACDESLGEVRPDETVNGNLQARGCLLGSAPADPWTLIVDGPARIRVDLTSSNFDPVLQITDEDGYTVAWNDDGGTGLNSRIVVDLDGTYTLWARAYHPSQSGRYRIRVSTAEGAALTPMPAEHRSTEQPALTLDRVLGAEKGTHEGAKR